MLAVAASLGCACEFVGWIWLGALTTRFLRFAVLGEPDHGATISAPGASRHRCNPHPGWGICTDAVGFGMLDAHPVRIEHPALVSIDADGRGTWEVLLPEGVDRVCCATLDDARLVAYRRTAQRRPCELIVRDAYHRVIERQVIGADRRGEDPPGAGS